MKMPYQWLRDYAPVDADVKHYCAHMTMTGSKVEGYESFASQIRNVVCGRILKIEQHPNADKLVVCQIDVGGRTVQICTGAKNVAVGDLVPVALDDSLLPGGHEIHKTVMRGVESNGMLCSVAELNLTTHDVPYAIADGILILQEEGAKPGDDIRPVLGLDDTVIEFEITPNRPDCLSMIGLARETAASFEVPLTLPAPELKHTSGDIREHLSVEIEAPDLCTRYAAAMAKNIKIGPSPKWMRERLRNAGVRPINNIVDITNYVMLEYGQPMHAFDYGCIEDRKIIVRRSRPGEKVTTLDGVEREVAPDTLLITDPKKAVGIAGVMGGQNSEITEQTRMIVFESATFSGSSIRLSSRKVGMRTEASGRFEKGLDSDNALPALLRACQLVEELGAGELIGGVIDEYPNPKQPRMITLEPERTRRFIGAEISDEEMRRSLRLLGFGVNGNEITVPSWRDDVVEFADLAEEVARIYGYDKIEPTSFAGEATMGGLNARQAFERDVRRAAASVGFSEAITYSFLSPKAFDRIALPENSPLRYATRLINPLGEDQSLMRTTPMPAMLEAVARNYNFRTPALRLFELASVYLPVVRDGAVVTSELPHEKKYLTLALYGDGDFYTVKGAAAAVLRSLSIKDMTVVPCRDNPSYHPGRCGSVLVGAEQVGVMGQIHPAVAEAYGIDTDVYFAELDLERLLPLRDTERVYHALPRFPALTRDLAVLVDEQVTVLELERVIDRVGGEALAARKLFDVYRGAQVPEGKKSVAFALSFRHADRTLTDAEADADLAAIRAGLETEFGAQLRR